MDPISAPNMNYINEEMFKAALAHGILRAFNHFARNSIVVLIQIMVAHLDLLVQAKDQVVVKAEPLEILKGNDPNGGGGNKEGGSGHSNSQGGSWDWNGNSWQQKGGHQQQSDYGSGSNSNSQSRQGPEFYLSFYAKICLDKRAHYNAYILGEQ